MAWPVHITACVEVPDNAVAISVIQNPDDHQLSVTWLEPVPPDLTAIPVNTALPHRHHPGEGYRG